MEFLGLKLLFLDVYTIVEFKLEGGSTISLRLKDALVEQFV